jgi:hypothetical protein
MFHERNILCSMEHQVLLQTNTRVKSSQLTCMGMRVQVRGCQQGCQKTRGDDADIQSSARWCRLLKGMFSVS